VYGAIGGIEQAKWVSECREKGHITVRSEIGYISSEMRVSQASDCGWQITSRPGQRVQLELASFGGDGGSSSATAETDAEVQSVIDGGHSGTCHEVKNISQTAIKVPNLNRIAYK